MGVEDNIFIQHIKSHLEMDELVKCKECGKTIVQIWEEYVQKKADEICKQFDITDKEIQDKMDKIYSHIVLDWEGRKK